MKALTPFKTKDNLYYSFISYFSNNYVIAHPLYYPTPSGNRTLYGECYKKFEKNIDSEIYKKYPPFKEIDYWAVKIPLSDIVNVYDPLNGFKKMIASINIKNDMRYDFINDFYTYLNEDIGLLENIGVLGSYCVGLNNINSDIDIVIYSSNEQVSIINYLSSVVKKKIATCMSSNLAYSYANRYHKKYTEYDIDYLYDYFSKDVTKLYIEDKKISVILCENESHFEFNYSDLRINRDVNFIGKIVCLRKSFSYPRKYKVLNVITNKVVTIVSYHWFFKGLKLNNGLVNISCHMLNEKNFLLNKENHFIKNY